MGKEHVWFGLDSVIIHLGAMGLVMIMARPILAQRPAPPPGTFGNDVDPAKVRIVDNTKREMALRDNGSTTKAAAADTRQVRASIDQIKQDFIRIQVVRNELVRAILKGPTLDNGFVLDKTKEIRRSASRLKAGLRLYDPNDEKNEKKLIEVDQTRIKGELVKLCNVIFSFTENPTLKSPDLVDIHDAAKARSDLQMIIDLSDGISTGAEKLSGAPKH